MIKSLLARRKNYVTKQENNKLVLQKASKMSYYSEENKIKVNILEVNLS